MNTGDTLAAILDVLVADATLADWPVYTDEAPEGVDPPYIVMTLIGHPVSLRTSTGTFRQPVIQLSCFSNVDKSTAAAAATLVRTALRNNPPEIEDPNCQTLCLLETNQLDTRDDRGVFHAMLEYQLTRADAG